MKIENPYSDIGFEGLFLPTENINKVDNLLNSLLNGGILENTEVFVNNEWPINNKKIAETNEEKEHEAEKRIQRYKQEAYIAFNSTEPYQLATFFCEIDSFTLSDIDFVRQYMLPASNKSIVNLMMISEFVEKINNGNEETNYKINEEAGLILRKSLRNKDYEAVKLLLEEKKSQESEKLEPLKSRL